jgi:hypothetical protein
MEPFQNIRGNYQKIYNHESQGFLNIRFLNYCFSPMPTTLNRSSISKDAALAASTTIASSMTSPLLTGSGGSSALDLGDDTDENKYKRRSAVTWLARWWRSIMGPGGLRGRRSSKKQHIMMMGFLVFLGFVTLIVVLHYFGRSNDEYNEDPMLDPLNNPNIRVGSN